GRPLELMTDGTWKVRRSPEADPNPAPFDDASWASARPLPGPAPVDEGPVLDPTGKPAEPGMDLALRLPAAVAGAARAGHIRAALRPFNPRLAALDRPNRERDVAVRPHLAMSLQAMEVHSSVTHDEELTPAAR